MLSCYAKSLLQVPSESQPRRRWISAVPPKVFCIAWLKAFAPFKMNRWVLSGGGLRSVRLSSIACTIAAFSLAPLSKPKTCLFPSALIPAASTVIMSLVRCSPSISVATRTRPPQVRRHPLAEGLPRQRLVAPRNAGLGEVGFRILRNAVGRKAGRPLAPRVETFLQSVRCQNLGLSTRRHLASPRPVGTPRGKRHGLPGLVGGGCCLCGEDRKTLMNRVASSLD